MFQRKAPEITLILIHKNVNSKRNNCVRERIVPRNARWNFVSGIIFIFEVQILDKKVFAVNCSSLCLHKFFIQEPYATACH